ncbi:MAG: GTP 3',8-cyclase MoaA, partial [Chloroflexota bacterium]
AQEWGEGFPAPADRYVSAQEMKAQLETWNLKPETFSVGNGPARTYRIPNALGAIGFISPLGEHFCQNCNRLRLTSDGKLRSCLVIPSEVSLRDALRSGQPLEPLFEQAIAQKPEHHDMLVAEPASARRGMSQLGG